MITIEIRSGLSCNLYSMPSANYFNVCRQLEYPPVKTRVSFRINKKYSTRIVDSVDIPSTSRDNDCMKSFHTVKSTLPRQPYCWRR